MITTCTDFRGQEQNPERGPPHRDFLALFECGGKGCQTLPVIQLINVLVENIKSVVIGIGEAVGTSAADITSTWVSLVELATAIQAQRHDTLHRSRGPAEGC